MPTNEGSMSIQICSDIHLEDNFNATFEDVIKPSAPYLILAGDVGNPFEDHYNDFLAFCSLSFEKVIVVSGNHEMYGKKSINESLEQINKVCSRFANVTHLNCSTCKLGDFTVIGLTLWSYLPEAIWKDAEENINDFKYIPDMSPGLYNRIHRSHLMWLQKQINSYSGNQKDKLIIVTHHAPSMTGTSLDRYKNDAFRYCYRSQLDHLISMPCNALWVCGHTHFSFQMKKGKCNFVSNQYRSKKYQRDFFVNI